MSSATRPVRSAGHGDQPPHSRASRRRHTARSPRSPRGAVPPAAAAVVAVGLLASGAMVWQSSYAAFSATTSNATNSWTAGSLALSDDDTNVAMFTATNLKPGTTGTKCIAVQSTGSLPSTVKLYGTSATTTNALSSYLDLTITQGTGGGYGSCTGFTPSTGGGVLHNGTLAAFASAATGFANGVGTWAPTGSGSETRVFQFTYTLQAGTPNSVQGGSAAIGFTWEAQS